jgi:recombination protein RecA
LSKSKTGFTSIEELFGDSAADQVTPTLFVDTGIPQLNSILTGDPIKGIPSGQLTEICGESGSGKTMLASRLMINAQKMGGVALFYDFERAYHLHLSVAQGLDPSKRKFFISKAHCMEDAFDDCIRRCRAIRHNNLITEDAPIIVIFDSFAWMVPKSMLFDKNKEKKMGDFNMKDMLSLAATSSMCLKAFAPEMNDLNVCAVFLNQVRSAPDGKGLMKSAGGSSLTYGVSTRINIVGTDLWTEDPPKKKIGKVMTFETIKNRTRRPFEKTQSDFLFDTHGGDFDVMAHYVAYLKTVGVLDKGTWVTLEGKKYQGTNQLVEFLKSESDGLQRLIKAQQDYIAAGNEIEHITDEQLAKEWSEVAEVQDKEEVE